MDKNKNKIRSEWTRTKYSENGQDQEEPKYSQNGQDQ